MIKLFSIEFWIGVQFFIDLIFVALLFIFIRQLKKDKKNIAPCDQLHKDADKLREKSIKTAGEIMDILEPLVRDAHAAADSFTAQIKEKKNTIKNINDALDSRIISINLLLSRAESLFEVQRQRSLSGGRYSESGNNEHSGHLHHNVFDQQKEILDLHAKGYSISAIASELAMPEGEVHLVISLKEKFIQMENSE